MRACCSMPYQLIGKLYNSYSRIRGLGFRRFESLWRANDSFWSKFY
ncbi:hypothetical protein Gotur_028385 [Gossypium turneri]